jgi:hypothetical protein
MLYKEKMIERNIELSAEFSRYLFEHPELEKKVPWEAEIVLWPECDAELKQHNLKLGKNLESNCEKVFYVTINSLRPKKLSRINKIKLSTVAA